MTSKIPNVVLNNGRSMPILGLGTWAANFNIETFTEDACPVGEVTQAVKDAIDIGYRHFDCALAYGNEHEIGAGVAAKIKEGVVKREDVFITSKLWNTFHSPKLVREGCETTLKNLGISYIDMYLVHWPCGFKEGGDFFPKDDKDQMLFSDIDYLDTWKEMEKLVDDGLCKSIGISNFNKKQIERVLAIARIPPATNQIECHPYLTQKKLMEFCKSKNISITAYSPLGSPSRPWARPDEPVLMEDPKIVNIAKKYNKTSAQILIRYQVQRGNICIPKSVNKVRMAANCDVFDFVLSEDDIKLIDTFDCNGRFVALSSSYKHPYHPFANDEY